MIYDLQYNPEVGTFAGSRNPVCPTSAKKIQELADPHENHKMLTLAATENDNTYLKLDFFGLS